MQYSDEKWFIIVIQALVPFLSFVLNFVHYFLSRNSSDRRLWYVTRKRKLRPTFTVWMLLIIICYLFSHVSPMVDKLFQMVLAAFFLFINFDALCRRIGLRRQKPGSQSSCPVGGGKEAEKKVSSDKMIFSE